ncbi:hypothetical protein KIN20_011093 [Parelaphostrongylus tenuis]|uniref:Uncharacterized protein n=1 Tax=Parelaphostrongylus tenuis TaxID=148309 RepID=A0AAD5MCC0_PARTN|nr:hypothetical protein KIN20_011093 [Parelaphostrongylus tenuis]
MTNETHGLRSLSVDGNTRLITLVDQMKQERILRKCTIMGSSTTLRSYIAVISTTKDRARTCSVIVIANMFSILVGPICQLIFASIRYSGFVLIENISEVSHLFGTDLDCHFYKLRLSRHYPLRTKGRRFDEDYRWCLGKDYFRLNI